MKVIYYHMKVFLVPVIAYFIHFAPKQISLNIINHYFRHMEPIICSSIFKQLEHLNYLPILLQITIVMEHFWHSLQQVRLYKGHICLSQSFSLYLEPIPSMTLQSPEVNWLSECT